MKRILIGALLVLGLLAGGMTAPAAADADGVGVLVNGIARVGSSMSPACDKDVDGTEAISGDGIYLPGIPNPNKDRKYVIQVPSVGFPANQSALAAVDDDGHVLLAKPLTVCGNVTKVFGNTSQANKSQVGNLGPWCGMSKGYNGKGKVKLYKQPENTLKYWLNIYDLGWKFSIPVGFLPLIGKYQEQNFTPAAEKGDEEKEDKKNKWGQILGLVSARAVSDSLPGDPTTNSCFNTGPNAGGPTLFHVDGVIVLKNSGTSKNDVPYRWNDDWTEGLPGRPAADKDNNDNPYFCKGSADLDNNGTKEYKCPYKTKPKDKPKTG